MTDDRPPLCVYCVMSAFFPSAYLGIDTFHGWDEEKEYKGPGFYFEKIPARARTPLNNFAGDVVGWTNFLRLLGPDYRKYAKLIVNQETVGGYAEMEFFGMQVCASHLWKAREDWLNKGKGIWT